MKTTSIATLLIMAIVPLWLLSGCTRHEVEMKPVEIKPIHITIDVNLKIDRDLEDFFGELDQAQKEEAAETAQ